MELEAIEQKIQQMEIEGFTYNHPVRINYLPPGLEVVGTGTDAVVVRAVDGEKKKVFKVFTAENLSKKEAEFRIYQQLKGLPYFATCYFQGSNYLCLSYEEGLTLYESLVEGIEIPEQVIKEVDQACEEIRQRGLHPRDIHLKNVIMQNGHAKLIDVAEYDQGEEDHRWQHLSQGYQEYYSLVRGRKIPVWVLETVKKLYFQQEGDDFSLVDFVRRLPEIFTFK
jgi:hypothetical protein